MVAIMARPIRIQYPGAVYQVMARGSHGQAVFGARRRPCAGVSERLAMHHFTRVSQAISQIQRRPARVHQQIQRWLRRAAGL